MLNYRQTVVTYSVYIQCDNTIHSKMLITSCKETIQLAHSRNTSQSHIYLLMVSYTYKACWLSWTTGKFQDFPGAGNFTRKHPGLSRRQGNNTLKNLLTAQNRTNRTYWCFEALQKDRGRQGGQGCHLWQVRCLEASALRQAARRNHHPVDQVCFDSAQHPFYCYIPCYISTLY